jgi:DNA replication protein DnaC
MEQVLSQIPNQLDKQQQENGITLSSIDEGQGTYCCVICKKEIKRMNLYLFGKPFRPLPVCNCVIDKLKQEELEKELVAQREKVKQLYGNGLIDEELKKASFETFQVRPGTKSAYQMANYFVEEFQKQEYGLYLFGSVGTGKSHLAAAIHHALLWKGYSSVFIDVTQLFGIAKSTFKDGNKKTDQDYIQAAIKADLLTLDEIGLSALTDYEFRILFQILNGRKGKMTNFTSNLNLDRLESWFSYDRNGKALDVDGRLFDRLMGSTLPICIQTDSYRKYQALERAKTMQVSKGG